MAAKEIASRKRRKRFARSCDASKDGKSMRQRDKGRAWHVAGAVQNRAHAPAGKAGPHYMWWGGEERKCV